MPDLVRCAQMATPVETVETLLAAHEGVDVLEPIRGVLNAIPGTPQDHEVAAALANDPGWSLYAESLEWDMSAAGIANPAHGLAQTAQWWQLWTDAFDSHVYENTTFKDLGEGWVLTKGDVNAENSEGPVNAPAFQLWKVAEEKVTVMRGFRTEADALAAPR